MSFNNEQTGYSRMSSSKPRGSDLTKNTDKLPKDMTIDELRNAISAVDELQAVMEMVKLHERSQLVDLLEDFRRSPNFSKMTKTSLRQEVLARGLETVREAVGITKIADLKKLLREDVKSKRIAKFKKKYGKKVAASKKDKDESHSNV
jgi:hypothetical protein